MNNDTYTAFMSATITLTFEDWNVIQYAMKVAIRNGMDGDLPKQVEDRLSAEMVKANEIWMNKIRMNLKAQDLDEPT